MVGSSERSFELNEFADLVWNSIERTRRLPEFVCVREVHEGRVVEFLHDDGIRESRCLRFRGPLEPDTRRLLAQRLDETPLKLCVRRKLVADGLRPVGLLEGVTVLNERPSVFHQPILSILLLSTRYVAFSHWAQKPNLCPNRLQSTANGGYLRPSLEQTESAGFRLAMRFPTLSDLFSRPALQAGGRWFETGTAHFSAKSPPARPAKTFRGMGSVYESARFRRL